MKTFIILCLCCMLAGISSTSCKKSEPACGSFGWSFALQDEIDNLSAAAVAYSQNNTPSNCQAYKQAYLDYIDALRGWERCLLNTADRSEWQHALDQAEQDAEDINC